MAAKRKGQADKRNLKLAREGVILSGTPAAIELSEAELTARAKALEAKTQRLK